MAERLDPPQRVEIYLELREKHLEEAESLYEKGDLAQAGEKYWGAAALLNAVAEKGGLLHYRDYAGRIELLHEETGNAEMATGFRMAEGLHANFYHNFMRKASFDPYREAVLKLVDELKRLL